MTPNRAPIRLTPRGERLAAWLILTGYVTVAGIIGGLERGTIPLPW